MTKTAKHNFINFRHRLLCAVLTVCTAMFSMGLPTVFSETNNVEIFGGNISAADSICEENTIKINSVSDFLDFCVLCKTDSASLGKTVKLMRDIDLSDIDFVPVATFGGIFDGGGHRISGVKIYGKGSHLGLFRYVQPGAVIQNLSVYGDVSPDGSAEYVGGIAGENGGTIKNCSFSGKVFGKTSVGGICGYISESGSTSDCSFRGKVYGKTYTGGICGQNFGKVENCDNRGAVNTVTIEEKLDLENIEINLSDVRSPENVDTNTDTGGICGYTKGTVSECVNYGDVGYRSVGYNTGGICGRQAGYIRNCENYGKINGRKDIGGIAGQAEPYILVEFSEDVLGKLKSKLADIKSIVTGINSPDDAVHDSFAALSDSISAISSSTEALSDSTVEYADSITDTINGAADRIHTALEDSSGIFESVSDGIADITDGLLSFTESGGYIEGAFLCIENALKQASEAEEPLAGAAEDLADAADKISAASNDFKSSIASLDNGADELENALRLLKKALKEKNEIENGFLSVRKALELIVQSFDGISGSLDEISAALKEIYEKGYIGDAISDTIESIEKSVNCFRNISKAIESVSGACLTLAQEFDSYSLATAFEQLSGGFSSVSDAFDSLEQTVRVFTPAINELALSAGNAQEAAAQATLGIEQLASGAEYIKIAVGRMGKIISDMTEAGAVKLPQVPDEFKNSLDGFFDSVETMQQKINELNDTLSDKKYDTSDKLSNLSDEIGALSGILSDAYNEYMNASEKDAVRDISDIDSDDDKRNTNGKISSSRNFGDIFGDINTGGIVGSVAVEYDFDPEDDIINSGERTLKFTYKTKCVVSGCTNNGSITGKKNCIGGIIGKMDLGSTVLCDNLGTVSSTDGSYVGGIAGKSDAVIRSCVSQCSIYGKNYVGGIAGAAKTIYDCRSLVNVAEYTEFAGSIAGSANAPTENLHGNYFVSCSRSLGAVDDINYRGAAEETDIDSFVDYVKLNFGKETAFTLTFCADDKIIEKISYVYNQPIPKEQIPKVPPKSGFFGKWSEYNFDAPQFNAVIKADYTRNNAIIQSEQKRSDGKSAVIVCGNFDDKAKVFVSEISDNPYEIKNFVCGMSVAIDCENPENEKYTVRYLPASEKHFDIYVVCSGKTEKVKTEKIGSYFEFTVCGNSFEIIEAKKDYTVSAIIITAICAAALAAVIIYFITSKKRKKDRKTNKKTQAGGK